jgi:hypothetical protein
MVGLIIHLDENENLQKCIKIRDSSYMEEFWHEDFVLLSYFIYLCLFNNYF